MLSARTRYDIRTARTGRSQVMLIQFCGYQLLGILEVVDGIELTREEVGDVEHAVGVSLGDETLESQPPSSGMVVV